MPGNYDDIIREVLGIDQRGVDDAQLLVPDDWKRSVPPGPRMNEGDMPPMTPLQEHSRRYWPVVPIPNNNSVPLGDTAPTLIPQNSPEFYPSDPERQTAYERKKRSFIEKQLQNMGLSTPSVGI